VQYRKLIYLCIYSSGLAALGCGNKSATQEDTVSAVNPKTQVTIANVVDTLTLNDDVTLNATASYLLKSDVKANTTGYITRVTVKLGDRVRKGTVLFGLQTKEARAIGNTINQLDPSFRFNGSTQVLSPATGYVAMVNHQIGDYVLDGDVLATITDANSFGFVMDVPYEYLNIFKTRKSVLLSLPDGMELTVKVSKVMPSVDPVAQTVKILLKVPPSENIPENLIGNVTFSKQTAYGLVVPKTAVVTDETQSSYWVMKLLNDTTAIKTPIQKGLEVDKWVQVKSGNLSVTDRVVTSGNFGMGDTAAIIIQKHR
jgi:multidrug efflux pump subunit AcrA (membrane-fusion protein)